MKHSFILYIVFLSLFLAPFQEAAAECAAVEFAYSLGLRYQATIKDRIKGRPLTLLNLRDTDALAISENEKKLTDCPKGTETEVLLADWAGGLLSFSTALQKEKSKNSDLFSTGVDPEFFIPRPHEQIRPKIIFFDIGPRLDKSFSESLSVEVQNQKLTLVGSLNPEISWDVGDLDSDPSSQLWHTNDVLKTSAVTVKDLVLKATHTKPEELPLFYPVKIYNSYEILNFIRNGSVASFNLKDPKSTEWPSLRMILDKTNPSVINFSGAFELEDEKYYRSFKRALISRPDLVLVNAAGNQQVDIDLDDSPNPYPSKFLNADGERLSNIVNVTAVDSQGNIKYNWGEKFVDVAVVASSTSLAAPQISAVVWAVKLTDPQCVRKRPVRETLKKLASRKSTGVQQVSILDPAGITPEMIRAACR